MAFLHVFLLGIALTSALYSSSSPVVKLTQENFEKEVLKSDELWIVEFFAPWCGHCKNLAPEYEKAARALKGIINVGAVDMTTDQSVGSPYGISGFPTLKFFGENKKSPLSYEAGRTAKDLVNYALKQAEEIATKRIGAKPEPKQRAEKKPEGEQKHDSPPPENDEDVIVLTDDNFDENVFVGDDIWFVEFYAPWCGHCKALAPEWAKAATSLKGQVKVAKVNSDTEKAVTGRYKIGGYPSIRIFTPGNEEPEEYSGARESVSITRFALNKLDSSGKPPTINQITSEAEFLKTCGTEVCIIAFLPHIFDSSANERNRYIETLTGTVKKNRSKPLKFLWAQAGDFYKFEQLLGLGSGYPSVAGISMSKNRFAVMRSSYIGGEIDVFVRKLLSGNIPLQEYKELPKIENVEAWDGKDHQPAAEPEDLDVNESEKADL